MENSDTWIHFPFAVEEFRNSNINFPGKFILLGKLIFMGSKARSFSDAGSRIPPGPEGSNGRVILRVLQIAWLSSHPFLPDPLQASRVRRFPGAF